MKMMDRDLAVLRELDRWRFALSRQLRFLGGFPSQRTCDRRLKFLIDGKYIERKHILYGVPGLYTVTHRGRMLIGSSGRAEKIKVDRIMHDISIIDTVIYFHLKLGIPLANITSDKVLHRNDGFGVRKHRPDFIYKINNKVFAVEIELTPKAKERMLKVLQKNFMAYDKQTWVVPNAGTKIRRVLQDNISTYPNIEVLSLEQVNEFVKQLGEKKA